MQHSDFEKSDLRSLVKKYQPCNSVHFNVDTELSRISKLYRTTEEDFKKKIDYRNSIIIKVREDTAEIVDELQKSENPKDKIIANALLSAMSQQLIPEVKKIVKLQDLLAFEKDAMEVAIEEIRRRKTKRFTSYLISGYMVLAFLFCWMVFR